MKKWPTLYKKTSTGAIQEWTIAVRGHPDWFPAVRIYTWHGQVDGKIQETSDLISKGKNIGKKNETTSEQQGIAEAQAKWEKQKKKGYVDNIEDAQDNRVDEVIEGGVLPMLAHKFSEQAHKIYYPAFVQPKLDGIRCIAIVRDGKCTLWSRTRKPITSMPHIVAQLEKLKADVILDGELYNHKYKTNFEHIVSMVRQEEPHENHADVEYHIYDIVSDEPFSRRATKLRYFKESWFDGHIVKVETHLVEDETQTLDFFQKWRSEGYEGAMIRNADGMYENKRSYNLQKVKEFDDAEFPIIGIEEGRGKLAQHVGSFICRTASGKEFLAKMRGETSRLRAYFLDRSLWEGKLLTVQYQGLTGKEGVPRFPVGVRMRDSE